MLPQSDEDDEKLRESDSSEGGGEQGEEEIKGKPKRKIQKKKKKNKKKSTTTKGKTKRAESSKPVYAQQACAAILSETAEGKQKLCNNHAAVLTYRRSEKSDQPTSFCARHVGWFDEKTHRYKKEFSTAADRRKNKSKVKVNELRERLKRTPQERKKIRQDIEQRALIERDRLRLKQPRRRREEKEEAKIPSPEIPPLQEEEEAVVSTPTRKAPSKGKGKRYQKVKVKVEQEILSEFPHVTFNTNAEDRKRLIRRLKPSGDKPNPYFKEVLEIARATRKPVKLKGDLKSHEDFNRNYFNDEEQTYLTTFGLNKTRENITPMETYLLAENHGTMTVFSNFFAGFEFDIGELRLLACLSPNLFAPLNEFNWETLLEFVDGDPRSDLPHVSYVWISWKYFLFFKTSIKWTQRYDVLPQNNGILPFQNQLMPPSSDAAAAASEYGDGAVGNQKISFIQYLTRSLAPEQNEGILINLPFDETLCVWRRIPM